MKTTKLLSLTITVLVALSQPTWARGGGGGGGRGGGYFGGAGFSGGHFGGARVGGFRGGGFGASPRSFGSTRFAGRSFGRSGGALRYYNGGGRMPGARTYTLGSRDSRSVTSNSRSRTPITRQPTQVVSRQARGNASGSKSFAANRSGSIAGRNRISNPRTSTAANRQSFIQNHAHARHDANWHRDWDRHHAHFHNNLVFVFANGFWWGLYPWDYYPYYGYYPYDDYGYDGYPYDDYDYDGSSPYSYYNGYAPSGQYSNGVVSAVQSKLTSLGYYHGTIDGVLGDQTEAALARYQQDQDISVTGTVTSATLQALDLPYSAGY
jgi:Putative peptidoglycan binding domain